MADFDFVETSSAKLYTEIIGALMDSCNEPLYPGDERRIFGDSLVYVLTGIFSMFNDRAKQKTLRYARGKVLDAIGERYGVSRAEPEKASATFLFSASAAQASNIVIPAGTRITTDGSVYFATQEAAVLPAGSMEIDLLGVCMEGGAAYNGFAVGSIGTLVDLIPFAASAVNITVSAGGDDGEPYTVDGDERFRERIRLSSAAQSTAGPESAYRYWALTADLDIVDVAIDCPEDEPNTVNIYPLMNGGTLPGDDTLQKVLGALADDVRPMTDLVQAMKPESVGFAVEIKYYCSKADESTMIQAIEGAGGAIEKYIEWQTTKLGRHIDPDQLRSYVFSAWAASNATGTVRIDIARPAYAEIGKTQFAQLSGTPIVTHEVIA